MSSVLASFASSAASGKKTVVNQAPRKPAFTTSPDPENPGMLKKCYNVRDPKANARNAGQFGQQRGEMGEEEVAVNKTGGQYRSSKLCNAPRDFYSDSELLEIYPNGVMSDSLVPDDTTGRVDPSSIAGHVNNLQAMNIVKTPPQVKVGGQMQVDMDMYVRQDNELYQSLQTEYCHYNERYMYALNKFLSLATSRDAKDNPAAQNLLELSRKLNIRVNSVLEIMNYLAQNRVNLVNSNSGAIESSNAIISSRLKKISSMFGRLKDDNAVVTTQREMVRYTEEKNAYTSNQIAVWTALNVLTLGAIAFVYRN
jgi:hypothetical protein